MSRPGSGGNGKATRFISGREFDLKIQLRRPEIYELQRRLVRAAEEIEDLYIRPPAK